MIYSEREYTVCLKWPLILIKKKSNMIYCHQKLLIVMVYLPHKNPYVEINFNDRKPKATNTQKGLQCISIQKY